MPNAERTHIPDASNVTTDPAVAGSSQKNTTGAMPAATGDRFRFEAGVFLHRLSTFEFNALACPRLSVDARFSDEQRPQRTAFQLFLVEFIIDIDVDRLAFLTRPIGITRQARATVEQSRRLQFFESG